MLFCIEYDTIYQIILKFIIFLSIVSFLYVVYNEIIYNTWETYEIYK